MQLPFETETRGGQAVKLLAYCPGQSLSLIGMIQLSDGEWFPFSWKKDGKGHGDRSLVSVPDLPISPEPGKRYRTNYQGEIACVTSFTDNKGNPVVVFMDADTGEVSEAIGLSEEYSVRLIEEITE